SEADEERRPLHPRRAKLGLRVCPFRLLDRLVALGTRLLRLQRCPDRRTDERQERECDTEYAASASLDKLASHVAPCRRACLHGGISQKAPQVGGELGCRRIALRGSATESARDDRVQVPAHHPSLSRLG